MITKTLWLALLISLPCTLFCQKIIWVHRPFSEQSIPTWRYSQDTVAFSSNSQIWALVYAPEAGDNAPQIALSIKNSKGTEKTANFDLQKLDPSQLNWHQQIKKRFQFMLKSPHWYYFEITPNPMVTNALDGVAFLEILNETAQERKKTRFSYKRADDTNSISCTINFRTSGLYQPLWDKLGRYQKILANKKEVESKQAQLRAQCTPPGYDKIVQWSGDQSDLKEDLTKSDLDVFMAVENLKILTESIPDAIASNLKRELRSLFMMDLTILEMAAGQKRSDKIRQKNDLVKQLSLYTELQPVLYQYQRLTTTAGGAKKVENNQENALEEVAKLYAPFAKKHEAHMDLQKELDRLDTSLLKFD